MNAGSLASLCLVLGITVGCGRSLRDGHEADGSSGTSTGGGAGEPGSSGGSSGSSGSSAQGGSAEGGSGQGGSAEGGTAQGGSSGDAGAGGQSTISPRLFLQTGNALLATDPETSESIELCPEANASVRYALVDWVNERAILHRQFLTTPAAGELLRVALDGSECASLLLSESVIMPFSPVVGGRIVFATVPMAMSAFERPNSGDSALVRLTGLASIALDGTAFEVLAPNGVAGAQIVGEHVMYLQSNSGTRQYELYSALPDASSVITPVPVVGPKSVSHVSGRRAIVNVQSDVYAVDADGGNLAALATGPDVDQSNGIVGNHVVIVRLVGSGTQQRDLLSVDVNGGELVALASSSDDEAFAGSIGERVVYGRNGDLYSVRLDGSDTLPITQTTGTSEFFAAAAGDRVVFGAAAGTPNSAYFSAAFDGSGTVTLHESSTGLAAVVGDRVVFYVGSPNYDLVSVPVAGGEAWLLADGAEPDWLVGRLGQMLVIQRGDQVSEGAVFRIDVDGSRGALLAASARYVGAVTEACGAVPAGNSPLADCP